MKLGKQLAGLILVAWAAGCGSGGGETVDTKPFEGAWKFDSELVSASCPGLGDLKQDLTGRTMTLTKGTGAELLLDLFDMCKLTFIVTGNTATAKAGQKCSIPVSTFGNQEVEVTLWTLTTADGMTLTTEQKGTVFAGMCMATGSGMATKQP